MTRILYVSASARSTSSYSRKLGSELLEHLSKKHPNASIENCDIAEGLPFVTEAWTEANFTAAADRSAAQNATLQASDSFVQSLQAADILVIATPMYNFSVPATLKAWIDQIARANVTFRYTEDGPVGLLENKKAYIVVTSGGTEVGGTKDFGTGFLVHVLGFVGITDVQVINAGLLMADETAALNNARSAIKAA